MTIDVIMNHQKSAQNTIGLRRILRILTANNNNNINCEENYQDIINFTSNLKHLLSKICQ